ncbi:immune-associated nucleotide-binding protein 7 [Plakobranchus ocellatus]|uniref:Immune-associated nucleotide-binding protein 7 n=1 Tax=Plakobranchus ocellatus TaxID=259542 RepID=A0AAV3ZT83_9GAST|nr:immune-associated nucleotide-binding protein 7 [Plakobranchus ocellatus]
MTSTASSPSSYVSQPKLPVVPSAPIPASPVQLPSLRSAPLPVLASASPPVVDSKGIFDTRLNNNDNLHEFSKSMARAMSIHSGLGYHAILIVLKYGNRLTQEELDGIDAIKKIFDEDVFRKHGIIIMTCGDTYEREVTATFQDWCGQQTGPFKDLVDDCAGRILLFDNFTKDEAKITAMIDLDTSIFIDQFKECRKLEKNTEATRDSQLRVWRRLSLRCTVLERAGQGQERRTRLHKQIPVFQETLNDFIGAKENETQDTNECYIAMSKAFEELRTVYRKAKALSIAILVGKAALTVTLFVGLAGVIVLAILCPPSAPVLQKIAEFIVDRLGIEIFRNICEHFERVHFARRK